MNKYHIQFSLGDTKSKKVVEATSMAWSEAGLYEFVKINSNGEREPVAYYPVNRTIIEKIEYNVGTKTK